MVIPVSGVNGVSLLGNFRTTKSAINVYYKGKWTTGVDGVKLLPIVYSYSHIYISEMFKNKFTVKKSYRKWRKSAINKNVGVLHVTYNYVSFEFFF